MITDPGVYTITADEYHAHPALSSSGARKLLAPSCPALFRWWRDHEQAPSRVFDFGHAAHKMVLGDGPELVVIDADSYRTKAAQVARDNTYALGMVPLLPAEYQTVLDMACELRAHPAAEMLRRPGKPEQSLFAKDEATGVMLRARIDWLPEAVDGRITIVDYKTAASVDPAAFARSIAKYGYYQQAAWYISMVGALDLADDVRFLFVAQEKIAPYLVTVFELDEYSLRIGRRRNREAIEVFARCTEAGEWPGYVGADDVQMLSLPAWMEAEEEMSL